MIRDAWKPHVVKTRPSNPEMQEIQDEFEDVVVEEPEDVSEAKHAVLSC